MRFVFFPQNNFWTAISALFVATTPFWYFVGQGVQIRLQKSEFCNITKKEVVSLPTGVPVQKETNYFGFFQSCENLK